MYQLDFSGEEGQARFAICHQAIVLTQSSIPVSQWDDCVGLLKKLKSIGVPSGQRLGKTEILDLASDRSKRIQLERTERQFLIERIAQPMWKPDTLEEVMATKLWLDTLDEAPDDQP